MIEFNGKEYRTRELESPDGQIIKVSTSDLNDELMDEKGSYVSVDARYVDEQLAGYLNPHEFIDLKDREILYQLGYDGLNRFDIQDDMLEENTRDLLRAIADGNIVALVDETKGGIVGYILRSHYTELIELLNNNTDEH